MVPGTSGRATMFGADESYVVSYLANQAMVEATGRTRLAARAEIPVSANGFF